MNGEGHCKTPSAHAISAPNTRGKMLTGGGMGGIDGVYMAREKQASTREQRQRGKGGERERERGVRAIVWCKCVCATVPGPPFRNEEPIACELSSIPPKHTLRALLTPRISAALPQPTDAAVAHADRKASALLSTEAPGSRGRRPRSRISARASP